MNYDRYKLNIKEAVISLLEWMCVSGLFAYFFYRSLVVFFILFLISPIYLFYKKKIYKEKRKWKMLLSFKDAIGIVAANVSAGCSLENSFFRAIPELKTLYGEKDEIVREFEKICIGINNNLTVESLILDFGERSHISEIEDFADILAIAKRSGGNISGIISVTAEDIRERVETQKEIKVIMSEKRLESRIMCVVPFGIILYINSANPGFFDPLYHNAVGIAVMSICLTAYVAAFVWGEKIANIG